MQITVLGATRLTGGHAAKKALDNGHIVIVLVRGGADVLPSYLKNHAKATENLKVIKGDATNKDDLKAATQGSDAVLNMLGGRNNLKTTIARDSTKALHAIEGANDNSY
jgi:uncharacterized protein YbjT (DUF2867 family)